MAETLRFDRIQRQKISSRTKHKMVDKKIKTKTKGTKKTKSLSLAKKLSLTEEVVKELFKLVGVKVEVGVVEDKDNEAIRVNLSSEGETGLLIGSRGETIDSIQSVLGMIFRQRTGEWQRIIVNVADWRERQESKLKDLAEKTALRVKESGKPQPLYNLSASERRIVHLSLLDDEDVETESVGEGRERCLMIRLKSGEKSKQ